MDSAQDERLTKYMNRGMLVLLGAGVTLAAFLAVIQGWHAFNAKTKIVSIGFLLVLVMYPMAEIRTKKTKQDNDLLRFSGLLFGYVLIVLALVTFTGR
jgi:predicted MFS family arabinose efflux permease